jgi:hypothetical protein
MFLKIAQAIHQFEKRKKAKISNLQILENFPFLAQI